MQASSAHTVGVVGGGQLGRMLAEAAAPLGVDVVVVDPTPGCPASRVAEQIEGGFDDHAAIEELTQRSDAVTVEIELADPDALAAAAEAHDTPVHPNPETLRTIRDKLVQTRAFDDAGVPLPAYRAVDEPDDLRAAVEAFGEVMCKARTGGYDGRGNVPVSGDAVETDKEFTERLTTVGAADGTGAVAEEFVDFERELSVIGVVGDDEIRTYPPTETIHEAEILRETLVPARTTTAVRERARSVARDVLSALDGRGVYGIELFETTDGKVLLNEVAPRPHNSGHWTIEGAVTSQFENHVRAVLGLPLGSTAPRGPTATANLLGGEQLAERAESDDDGRVPVVGFETGVADDVSHDRGSNGNGTAGVVLRGVESVLAAGDAAFHWYGKRDVYPLRKVGHVTVSREWDETADDEGDTTAAGTGDTTAAGESERHGAPEAVLAAARTHTDRLQFDTP